MLSKLLLDLLIRRLCHDLIQRRRHGHRPGRRARRRGAGAGGGGRDARGGRPDLLGDPQPTALLLRSRLAQRWRQGGNGPGGC